MVISIFKIQLLHKFEFEITFDKIKSKNYNKLRLRWIFGKILNILFYAKVFLLFFIYFWKLMDVEINYLSAHLFFNLKVNWRMLEAIPILCDIFWPSEGACRIMSTTEYLLSVRFPRLTRPRIYGLVFDFSFDIFLFFSI